jgi:hypothetical protein
LPPFARSVLGAGNVEDDAKKKKSPATGTNCLWMSFVYVTLFSTVLYGILMVDQNFSVFLDIFHP